ncbi:helix-turn-helix domain-containing protein [Streptomyces sp. NBC_00193]|nr:helix-turn-helix domain-containing protein [Streptomyces sp. NBC_00347]MCX5296643.1 helix-turn-helix domain-containing protein [Streptomyces sp. NBC_00193]
MALEHPSAPSCASSRLRAATPRSGVIHVNTWHTSHYTVVGNHLLQHRSMSLVAIGLAAHIQSLPDGAPVGIKALAEKFPEGEVRIGSALRELERHGYLERRRERLDGGRVMTRTYSYNKPGAPSGGPLPPRPPSPPPPCPSGDGEEAMGEAVREPLAEPESAQDAEVAPALEPVPDPDPDAEAAPALEPVRQPAEPVRESEPGRPAASAPVPLSGPAPAPEAVGLLAGLRRNDPRLLLSERDVARLAPGVSAWLERGVDPAAIGQVLSQNLPAPLRSAASVLAYRLTALIPPAMPPAPPAPGDRRRPDPLQNCDGCDRAFRAPEPGRCRTCPSPPGERAAA